MPVEQESLSIPSRPYKRCTEHPEEELKYICGSCDNVLICSDCVVHGIHKSHQVQALKVAYPRVRSEVERFTRDLNERIDRLKSAAEDTLRSKEELLTSGKTMKADVRTAFEEVQRLLIQQQDAMLGRVDQLIEDDAQQLEIYSKSLSERTLQLEAVHDYTADQLQTLDAVLLFGDRM